MCCFDSGGLWRDVIRARFRLRTPVIAFLLAAFTRSAAAATPAMGTSQSFPRPVSDYTSNAGASLWQVLTQRVTEEPFNLVASLIFLCAIIHTFLAPKFRRWAHAVEKDHAAQIREQRAVAETAEEDTPEEVSFKGQVLHFLGEVEVIFGIWAVVLMLVLGPMKGWQTPVDYVG